MKNIIVVDDFYHEPLKARDLGLRCEYLPKDSTLEGEDCIESKKSYFSQGHVNKLESLVGTKICYNPEKYAFGVFALAQKHQESRSKVHIDPTDWVGIIYLSDNSSGGTNIYKHKQSGLSCVPNNRGSHRLGYKNKQDLIEKIVKKDGENIEKWELSDHFKCKFNRLLLIRAKVFFHKAESYFGTDAKSGRLTQLFFFNEAKKEDR